MFDSSHCNSTYHHLAPPHMVLKTCSKHHICSPVQKNAKHAHICLLKLKKNCAAAICDAYPVQGHWCRCRLLSQMTIKLFFHQKLFDKIWCSFRKFAGISIKSECYMYFNFMMIIIEVKPKFYEKVMKGLQNIVMQSHSGSSSSYLAWVKVFVCRLNMGIKYTKSLAYLQHIYLCSAFLRQDL